MESLRRVTSARVKAEQFPASCSSPRQVVAAGRLVPGLRGSQARSGQRGAHLRGALPSDPEGPHRCVLRSVVAAGEERPRDSLCGLCPGWLSSG